jgi:hypothetical protein
MFDRRESKGSEFIFNLRKTMGEGGEDQCCGNRHSASLSRDWRRANRKIFIFP